MDFFFGGGTLVSIGVKVADKGKIGWVIKLGKIAIKLLLGIVLDVLSPNMSHLIIENWK